MRWSNLSGHKTLLTLCQDEKERQYNETEADTAEI